MRKSEHNIRIQRLSEQGEATKLSYFEKRFERNKTANMTAFSCEDFRFLTDVNKTGCEMETWSTTRLTQKIQYTEWASSLFFLM